MLSGLKEQPDPESTVHSMESSLTSSFPMTHDDYDYKEIVNDSYEDHEEIGLPYKENCKTEDSIPKQFFFLGINKKNFVGTSLNDISVDSSVLSHFKNDEPNTIPTECNSIHFY